VHARAGQRRVHTHLVQFAQLGLDTDVGLSHIAYELLEKREVLGTDCLLDLLEQLQRPLLALLVRLPFLPVLRIRSMPRLLHRPWPTPMEQMRPPHTHTRTCVLTLLPAFCSTAVVVVCLMCGVAAGGQCPLGVRCGRGQGLLCSAETCLDIRWGRAWNAPTASMGAGLLSSLARLQSSRDAAPKRLVRCRLGAFPAPQ
jgi:hypothetical protein